MRALMTNKNKPNVKIVIGMVRIVKIGFKDTFNKESTTTTINAVCQVSTFTKESNRPANSTISKLNNNLIISFFMYSINYTSICGELFILQRE